jgi:heptaprenyl diphosphate synthase
VTAEQLYDAPHAPDGHRVHAPGLLRRLGPDAPAFQARLGKAPSDAEHLLRVCTRNAAHPRAGALTGHLAATGGKRLRPLLAAEFGDPAAPGVDRAAVTAERVHPASLCHDDVAHQVTARSACTP